MAGSAAYIPPFAMRLFSLHTDHVRIRKLVIEERIRERTVPIVSRPRLRGQRWQQQHPQCNSDDGPKHSHALLNTSNVGCAFWKSAAHLFDANEFEAMYYFAPNTFIMYSLCTEKHDESIED